ncbi:penicillin-binding transpeptidase domain-containing protein [Williamsia sterculiae]|uniref:Cell division protein FtsI/penicillin-binding protein 2 n=1 Tax=Williamsia sterculiae TaxID=1344003 RepID=A0A1N7GEL8_9NOCA|nr:penicillin-binding transpeptidase domain-containing protein [Williamsia sterculiae]SIS10952.1 Cell division protein FtsI/penicillin-binding protein 2 [Williamsia sterculiae]
MTVPHRPSRRTLLRSAITVVSVAVLTVTVVSCSEPDDGPRAAAGAFLADVGARHTDRASADTDDPTSARTALDMVWNGLQATAMTADTTASKITGDTASVTATYHWTLPSKQVWTYQATLAMARTDSGWKVRWSNADIHPGLGSGQQIAAQTLDAPMATVNETDGTEILRQGEVVAVRFDASVAAQRGSVGDAATTLAELLTRYDPTLSAQKIAEESTAQQGPHVVATLQSGDYDKISDQLAAVAGVDARRQGDLLPTDPTFAPEVVGQVKSVVAGELGGTPGWRVVTLGVNGQVSDVLAQTDPRPAPAVTVGLSRQVQNAAQRAVDVQKKLQTMMVVIQPSTGRLLAIAQNEAATKAGPLATMGLYPPGSTFKMVTSAAAFNAKMVTPQTTVGCPGEVTIGQRSVPNYDGFALGDVPLQTAFARSCNTTFAKLASEMGPSDLAHAATAMGVGPGYAIPGMPAQSGSVPIAPELVSRTEDGFGQGKVVATPLGMALVAATVQHGTTPVPQLILNRRTEVTGPRAALAPGVLDQLRPMMRQVVVDGTADRISDQGEVYGKTGEAEVPGGSHAWFAGYRGDIAFATLIVLGGSSDYAVGVTRDFFAGLPEGYGQ